MHNHVCFKHNSKITPIRHYKEIKKAISVLAKEIVAPSTPPTSNVSTQDETPKTVCGNGVGEVGEDCDSCPADVTCSGKAECISGKCVLKKGFNWNIVIIGGIGIIVILGIGVGVFLMKKKGINIGLLEKIKGLFNKGEKSVEQSKVQQQAPVKAQPKVVAKKPVEDLSGLVNYFNANLSKYKKEDLVKQALGQGWKQEQINKVLSKLGK